MGLKDHLDDGTGHILELGLDLDYLHVKATDQQTGADARLIMDSGSSDTGDVVAPCTRSCGSSPQDDSEESAGSDSEPVQSHSHSLVNTLGDGSIHAVHPTHCWSPSLDMDSLVLDMIPQEPGPVDTLREYQTKIEFALKLGYAEDLVRLVLNKLGSDALINDVLGELVKLGSKPENEGGTQTLSQTTSTSSSSSSGIFSSCSFSDSLDSHPSESPSLDDKDNLRPIVIDGSNVAMSHGNKEMFSCHGIQLAVDWFLERGHRDITVFVPAWRKEQSRPEALITDQEILRRLEKDKILVFTPSRRIQGRRVVCYDDRFIVKLAYESDGIIVSNDNYRDLAVEKPEWEKFIDERLLMYSFVNDKFMPPDDPLGRHGPSLENFLRKRPITPEHKKQPCPYGKKCTYGHKCKFYHPERGTQPQRAVADELRASAKNSTVKSVGETDLVKSHSEPGDSRNDKASDGQRSQPKKQLEPSIRALSYSDVEDKLCSKTKADLYKSNLADLYKSNLALPPAPGGPPSCHGYNQDLKDHKQSQGEPHTKCESPNLYYSMVRAYSGLSLPSQSSPECHFLSDADPRTSSVASDCSSDGSMSSDSYGMATHNEHFCMSSPDLLLDEGIKCLHHHHHRRNDQLPPVIPQGCILTPATSNHPGFHHSIPRVHSFALDDQQDPYFQHSVLYKSPQRQHQVVSSCSSYPGDSPPLCQSNTHSQNSPLGHGLASARVDSVSDSRLYKHSPLLPRKHNLSQERKTSWDPYYRQHPQPCYKSFSFQDLSKNREQMWRMPWGCASAPPPPHLSYLPHVLSHQHQEPLALNSYQEVREKVFTDLCNIFPTELVQLVMGRHPHVTNAQQLAAVILAEKNHIGY